MTERIILVIKNYTGIVLCTHIFVHAASNKDYIQMYTEERKRKRVKGEKKGQYITLRSHL